MMTTIFVVAKDESDVEHNGHNLTEVHIGRDKNNIDRIGNLGITQQLFMCFYNYCKFLHS